MVSQRCPRCASGRVRRGYRPTPIWSKVLFRYNLLCDNCNWEFTGFAIPGTVSTKPTKKPKKTTSHEHNQQIEKNDVNGESTDAENEEAANADGDASTDAKAKKKRVKIKF
jgi:ribosomal protein L37AE/L43A